MGGSFLIVDSTTFLQLFYILQPTNSQNEITDTPCFLFDFFFKENNLYKIDIKNYDIFEPLDQ